MNDIFRFVLGSGVILGLIVLYSWVKNLNDFTKAKEKLIKEDMAQFGQCCGLEGGACTFQPRLDKLNAAEKDKK
jgi:hypothetical protein